MRVLMVIIFCFLFSCSSQEKEIISTNGSTSVSSNNNSNQSSAPVVYSEWLIPKEEIFDGGPGKDGIPSIDSPVFKRALDKRVNDYLSDDDLVVGIQVGGIYKAYPHKILNWHEIVNDKFSDFKVTLSYCPLTGTALAWKYAHKGENVVFGVSGLLYNSNLILYDRTTDSNWSQLKMECVNGELLNEMPEELDLVEMPWGEWKKKYPFSLVLSEEQGFDRNYLEYPYGPYLDIDDFLLFPVNPVNKSYPNKERMHAIIENNISIMFRFDSFVNGNAIKKVFFNKTFLIVGNKDIIKSFELSENQKEKEYSFMLNGTTFFVDEDGNEWSVFGEAINGDRKGDKLKNAKSVTGFWFSLAAFYPDPEVY